MNEFHSTVSPAREVRADACIGVSDHGGWAILVTAAPDGTLLDRRRVDLVEETLPKIPHHSEGQLLPIQEAVALVDRVRVSAEHHAKLALNAVATALPGCIKGIALRHCPELPATIAERIADYRARNVADWVMYRQALAAAAETHGWAVHWYNPKKVFAEVSEPHLLELRKSIGPPWSQDHRLAMAAAVVAAKSLSQK